MIYYPWFDKIYKIIITNYQNNNLHHAIMIESYNIDNVSKLIWKIIQRIFCNDPIGFNHCCQCKQCILIKTKNHVDFYILVPKKYDIYIPIENIRNILNNIKNTAQQNNIKILWIPNYNTLTILGINTLLKIIEEPPKNTFFFIGNKKNNKIHDTIKSRLLLYQIFEPNEKKSLTWLKKYTKFNKIKCLIALRYNNNNPELAKHLLYKEKWSLRYELYNTIFHIIDQKNFLILLPLLNNQNIQEKIYWIIVLLLDSLKFKNEIFKLLINIDQLPLIKKISNKYSYQKLYNIFYSWQYCRYELINIKNINHELLLLKQLLKWKIF